MYCAHNNEVPRNLVNLYQNRGKSEILSSITRYGIFVNGAHAMKDKNLTAASSTLIIGELGNFR